MTSTAAAVVDDAKQPLLEGRGLSQILRGERRPLRRGPRRSPRRGPCRRRRERRRQIDADQDPRRRLSARCGALLLEGSEKTAALAARGARQRHRRHPPGAVARATSLDRGEHLSRPFPHAPRRHRSRRNPPPHQGAAGAPLRRGRCRAARRRAQHRPAADGGDRQGALLQAKAPHPRRADRGARPGPRADALQRHRPIARAGHGDRLHLPSPGGDFPDRRPRDGAPRRQAHRLGARSRHRPGLARQQDDRARIPAARAASAQPPAGRRWR